MRSLKLLTRSTFWSKSFSGPCSTQQVCPQGREGFPFPRTMLDVVDEAHWQSQTHADKVVIWVGVNFFQAVFGTAESPSLSEIMGATTVG